MNAARQPPSAQAARRIVVSSPLFTLSPALLVRLEKLRDERGADDITTTFDAFLLDGGLGPPTYLTRDGRIVWDDDIWDVRGTRAQAFVGLIAGVQKLGLTELRQLLPTRNAASVDCPECDGSGLFDAHGALADVDGKPYAIVCPTCAGVGWTAPWLDLDASVVDFVQEDGAPISTKNGPEPTPDES